MSEKAKAMTQRKTQKPCDSTQKKGRVLGYRVRADEGNNAYWVNHKEYVFMVDPNPHDPEPFKKPSPVGYAEAVEIRDTLGSHGTESVIVTVRAKRKAKP